MIRVGPAGWAYKDWEGKVYPKPRPKDFKPLAYIARYFNTVEINTSYYGAPKPESARDWLAQVSDNKAFKFSAKLLHTFTHERNPTVDDERDVKAGLAPILEAHRLGALLLQFPWSFKNTPENVQYVVQLQKRFADYPLVLEVRHSSWIEDAFLNLLAELGIGLCNIDQPLFHRSVKPAAHTTSAVGYIRLHGRNYQNWFSAKANVRERYEYLYSLNELDPWAARVKEVQKDAEDVYAVTNNHSEGRAVVNALELASLVDQPTEWPETLAEAYPGRQNERIDKPRA